MRDGASERQGRLPRTTAPAKQSSAALPPSAGYRSDSDDESDWDFGVGNLVIDLDADIEKTKASNNNNTLSSNNNLASPHHIPGQQQQQLHLSPSPSPSKTNKMSSSVEHQATVDNKAAGIKMKIKRKPPSTKSSEAKHEIIKNEGKCGGSSPGDSNSSGGSPMEKSKNANSTDKDKSKGRSVHGKKVKDRSKASNNSQNNAEQMSNGGNNSVFVMSPSSNSNTSSGNSNPTTNVNLYQVGTVSVELDRLCSPFPGPAGCPSTANCSPAAPHNSSSSGPGCPTGNATKKDVTEDPYDFNVHKVEPDRPLGFPVKKIKVEKTETASSPITSSTSATQDAGTETCHVGTITEPECLGPCEPGTSVTLEGIVWQETENGVLVVNVTWRGKTYVGTLLDATKHDWAPPRFSCDSPTSDFEARTPKGRGKRRAAAANISLNENSLGDTRKLRKGRSGRANNVFTAPPSPAKSEASVGGKRKGRPVELELKEDGPKASKRCRSNSRGTPNSNTAAGGELIECPEPNCNKKYKHINGLRYHQTHAHQNNSPAAPGEDNADEDMKETSSEESIPRSPSPAPAKPEKPERPSKKGKKNKQTAPPPPPSDSADLDDDDKPLSQISGASPKKKASQAEDCTTPAKEKKAEGAKKDKQAEKSQTLPPSAMPASQVPGSNPNSQPPQQALQSTAGVGPTLLTIPEIKTEPRDPSTEKSKKKGDKEKKNKSGSVAAVSRPLMPAPGSAPATSATGPHPMPGAQSGLKPLQPKPNSTEPSNGQSPMPPVKRPKKKRKQDKDAPPANPNAPANNPLANNMAPQSQPPLHTPKNGPKDTANGVKEDVAASHKSESLSVIKTLNPSPMKMASEADSRTREQGAKMPPDITKSVAPSKEPMDLATKADRMARPPSSLSVNSPVQMTSENRDHNEDAQSPAYSDISDESAPTLENEGAKPVKEEKLSNSEGAKAGDRSGEHGMTNPYGMYYYGQPPYLIPAVPQQQGASTPNNQTPTQARPSPKIPPSATVTSEKDPLMMEIKQEPGVRQNKEGELENLSKKDSNASNASSHKGREETASKNPTPSNAAEYQQQQKMLQQQQQQQQMYGMSPYYYNYGIEPAYHMHLMANEPAYRQQHEKMLEQEKRRQEAMSKEGEKSKDRHSSDPCLPSPGSRHQPHGKQPGSSSANPGSEQPHGEKRASPSKPPLLISERDRKMRELEKQNENHQILKENIELKNQMPMTDKGKYDGSYESEQSLRDRQAEELQRYYMYQQQQRMMEQHHKPTDLRKDPNKDKQSAKEGKEQDAMRERRTSDVHRSKEGDLKRPPMDKLKGEDDRGRQTSPSPRSTPKLKEAGAGPPSSTPTSLPTTYAQYLPQQPYLPSGPYSGIPSFDPSHPMYRAAPIIGYAGGPYFPPHQMRYMASMDGVEKDKALSSPGSASGSEPPSGKALDILQQHAAYYSPSGQHKIHELTEIGKARDLSNSSPAKGSDRSTPSDRAEKARSPPPQRHLHTHHHTHVVNPGYPIYDPYGALIASSQAANGLSYLPK